MKPKAILVLVLAALCFIILIQNTEIVFFQFLFWKFSMSRIIMIAFLLLTGFFIGYFFSRIAQKKKLEPQAKAGSDIFEED